MEKLNLPVYNFRITKNKEDKTLIFDSIRKKNVLLTPEEWVRQNIIRFLTEEKGFPAPLISIEAGLKANRFLRRYDALVYSRNKNPLMLIECKAPEVQLDQNTFDQVTIYNRSVQAPYLLVTNGLKHYCCKLDENRRRFIFLNEIPSYMSMEA